MNEQIIEWNILSHGGLSTSFSRILSQNLAGNTSFTFDLEMAGMLMKKTKVELNILRENGMKSNIAEVCMVVLVYYVNQIILAKKIFMKFFLA